MFGRAGKVKRAIARSAHAALEGAGDAAFGPIEKLRDDEQVEAYVDLCHQLIFEENLKAAEAAVDRALALAPTELYVLDTKAQVAAEDGRLADALATYRTMYEHAPTDPAVLSGLGDLLLKNDDAPGAIALLEPHAQSAEPTVQLRWAEALLASDRAAEALTVAEQVQKFYEAALRKATFVDNPEELKANYGEARRLLEDIVTELNRRAEAEDDSAAP